jgi:DnaJ family protein C protein 19
MIRLLPVALTLLVLLYLVPAGVSGARSLPAESRRRLALGSIAVLGVVVTVAVLARFGFGWLGVIGAAALGVIRTLAPLAARVFMHHRATKGSASQAAGEGPREPARSATMSRSQALDVLGLREGATDEQIAVAYRQLMRKVHPDTPGGSTYLAAQVNQARAVLLG